MALFESLQIDLGKLESQSLDAYNKQCYWVGYIETTSRPIFGLFSSLLNNHFKIKNILNMIWTAIRSYWIMIYDMFSYIAAFKCGTAKSSTTLNHGHTCLVSHPPRFCWHGIRTYNPTMLTATTTGWASLCIFEV